MTKIKLSNHIFDIISTAVFYHHFRNHKGNYWSDPKRKYNPIIIRSFKYMVLDFYIF